MTEFAVWKKSGIQEKLEAEGWIFMGNFEDRGYETSRRFSDGRSPTTWRALLDFGDMWKDVTAREAYDGASIRLQGKKAVYVRGKKESDRIPFFYFDDDYNVIIG